MFANKRSFYFIKDYELATQNTVDGYVGAVKS